MAELYLVTGPSGLQYIGATSKMAQERFLAHQETAAKGEGCHLQHAIHKHGADRFAVHTLVVGETDYIFALEDAAIAAYNTLSPAGYNMMQGGRGGAGNAEVRAKMSACARVLWADPTYRAKVVKAQTKGQRTPGARAKQSIVTKARWADPTYRAKVMKASAKGQQQPEVRAERSKIAKRLWADPAFKENMMKARANRKLKE